MSELEKVPLKKEEAKYKFKQHAGILTSSLHKVDKLKTKVPKEKKLQPNIER